MFHAVKKAYEAILAKLSRIQGSSNLVPELESLRFVAIASVFLTHLNGYLMVKSLAPWAVSARGGWMDLALKQGGLGVQLFFVISGFVLALPFARQRLGLASPVKLSPYFVRRLTRLEPPFLLCLLLLYTLEVFYNHQNARELLPHLAASAAYLHTALYHKMSTINGVTWSLEVEVQFYIAAPLLTLVFALKRSRARRLALVAACVGIQALQLWLGLGDDRDNPTLLNYLPYFLMGFILVDLYLAAWLTEEPRHWAWDLVIVAVAPAMLAFAMAYPEQIPLVLPWALLICFTAFFRGQAFRWLLSGRVPVTIGGMCYSIYLFHFAVISAFARFTKDLSLSNAYLPNLALQFLLAGAATLALAGTFFALVERPCMQRDWPQRLAAWVRAKLAVPAPAEP